VQAVVSALFRVGSALLANPKEAGWIALAQIEPSIEQSTVLTFW
jgi:hypothetical protein